MKKILLLLMLLPMFLMGQVTENNLYTYKAEVLSVYDGDTVTLLIDLGFNVSTTQKIRLYGIDTPELRKEEREAGLKARDVLRELILGKSILITTYKDKQGKYGRYLGTLFLGELNVNAWLVENGYGVYRDY